MYIINVSNNVFHSVVEKENRKISDGEQRSNLKIDSNKIHGKRTRWFLVDFSISHTRRLVIVRVNCVENCILSAEFRGLEIPIARFYSPPEIFDSFHERSLHLSLSGFDDDHFVGGFSSEYKGREN